MRGGEMGEENDLGAGQLDERETQREKEGGTFEKAKRRPPGPFGLGMCVCPGIVTYLMLSFIVFFLDF